MIEYDQWKQQRRSFRIRQIRLEQGYEHRAPGNRPRNPEKERLLIKMGKRRFQRWIESGKIEIVSPRHWKWRIGRPSEIEKE